MMYFNLEFLGAENIPALLYGTVSYSIFHSFDINLNLKKKNVVVFPFLILLYF